jgi:hypothetical protein
MRLDLAARATRIAVYHRIRRETGDRDALMVIVAPTSERTSQVTRIRFNYRGLPDT